LHRGQDQSLVREGKLFFSVRLHFELPWRMNKSTVTNRMSGEHKTAKEKCAQCGLECQLLGEPYDPRKCRVASTHYVNATAAEKMHRKCGSCGVDRQQVPAVVEFHMPLTHTKVVAGWLCANCKEIQLMINRELCECNVHKRDTSTWKAIFSS
jgi:hypothetical protein